MLYLIIILLSTMLVFIYMRYVPVRGVNCVSSFNPNVDSIIIVDVRDYNESYKDTILNAINIPVAYLNRYYRVIPSMKIHLIASSHLEKNISIRFLRKRGFKVIGYTLTDCNCKQQINQKTA